MTRRIRVGILFGGESGEHEVSLASARSVLAALDPDRYEAVLIGITREGRWLPARASQALLDAGTAAAEASNPAASGTALAPRAARLPAAFEVVGGAVDVVFPVLHGPRGEDGAVQGLLELARAPYVGAGVLGSAIGMDKIAMKGAFTQAGLPVCGWLGLSRRQWRTDPIDVQERIAAEIGFPCFVKPANLGSSVGISKVRGPAELPRALDLAAGLDRRLIVEQGVDARELECGVLGNDEPRASVVGEIIPHREFYDYIAKYSDGESDLIIPADIPPALAEQVRAYACRAFQAIDAAGLARVDFFLERASGRLLVNEINTIPGFTRWSMYPKLWEASGLSYSALIDELIRLALARAADR
ncbi:MAG: D-alanine--D-alanine ligase [Chloroflexi bacterium]|nr:D-alanine--D-alanine ligase [Chloroflexota bacterium]